MATSPLHAVIHHVRRVAETSAMRHGGRRLATLVIVIMTMPLAIFTAAADDALMSEVHAFLYEQASGLGDEVVIEVRPPSARLPDCESPEPFLPRAGQPLAGRVSVGVRCGAEGRQVRYLQAEIGIIGDYPVAARDIAPGSVIDAGMLETRQGDLARLPRQTVLEASRIIGQVAQRPLAAGSPLQEHQLAARALVERGQTVTVEARGSSFQVTREGEALEPGGQGERVRVRFGSRELITATVIGEARLAVDF